MHHVLNPLFCSCIGLSTLEYLLKHKATLTNETQLGTTIWSTKQASNSVSGQLTVFQWKASKEILSFSRAGSICIGCCCLGFCSLSIRTYFFREQGKKYLSLWTESRNFSFWNKDKSCLATNIFQTYQCLALVQKQFPLLISVEEQHNLVWTSSDKYCPLISVLIIILLYWQMLFHLNPQRMKLLADTARWP